MISERSRIRLSCEKMLQRMSIAFIEVTRSSRSSPKQMTSLDSQSKTIQSQALLVQISFTSPSGRQQRVDVTLVGWLGRTTRTFNWAISVTDQYCGSGDWAGRCRIRGSQPEKASFVLLCSPCHPRKRIPSCSSIRH